MSLFIKVKDVHTFKTNCMHVNLQSKYTLELYIFVQRALFCYLQEQPKSMHRLFFHFPSQLLYTKIDFIKQIIFSPTH